MQSKCTLLLESPDVSADENVSPLMAVSFRVSEEISTDCAHISKVCNQRSVISISIFPFRFVQGQIIFDIHNNVLALCFSSTSTVFSLSSFRRHFNDT